MHFTEPWTLPLLGYILSLTSSISMSRYNVLLYNNIMWQNPDTILIRTQTKISLDCTLIFVCVYLWFEPLYCRMSILLKSSVCSIRSKFVVCLVVDTLIGLVDSV